MYNGASRRLVPPMSSCRFTRHEAEERQGNRLTWLTGRRERALPESALGQKQTCVTHAAPQNYCIKKRDRGGVDPSAPAINTNSDGASGAAGSTHRHGNHGSNSAATNSGHRGHKPNVLAQFSPQDRSGPARSASQKLRSL
jgi:hypothetical protein